MGQKLVKGSEAELPAKALFSFYLLLYHSGYLQIFILGLCSSN